MKLNIIEFEAFHFDFSNFFIHFKFDIYFIDIEHEIIYRDLNIDEILFRIGTIGPTTEIFLIGRIFEDICIHTD